jgi:hypothetical protein
MTAVPEVEPLLRELSRYSITLLSLEWVSDRQMRCTWRVPEAQYKNMQSGMDRLILFLEDNKLGHDYSHMFFHKSENGRRPFVWTTRLILSRAALEYVETLAQIIRTADTLAAEVDADELVFPEAHRRRNAINSKGKGFVGPTGTPAPIQQQIARRAR